MQRYSTENDVCAWKNDSGRWVRYEDAAARISKLEAELVQRTSDTNAMVGNCEARIVELEAENQKFINHISFLQDKVAEFESALAAANAEIERLTGELSPLGLPAPYILRQTDNTK